MDGLYNWASFLLHNAPPALSPVLSTLLTARGYIQPVLSQLSSYTKSATQTAASAPDLATLALLLLVLVLSLKLLGMLYRAVLFWVRLAFRLVFWGGLIGGGAYVYLRGVEGVMEDVGRWGQVWGQEYERYKDQVEMARLEQQVRMGGAGRGRAW